ncbi:MAG: LysM peptidoglycan-binding domain-containing protein [Candidatus Woesearchaeota archaeon]
MGCMHTVQFEESLNDIAKKHNINIKKIKKLNPFIKKTGIHPGLVLKIR